MSTCIVGCGRDADGMCPSCWGTLSAALGAVEWLAVELDTTLSRQDRVSAGSVGWVTHTAEQPLPVNLGASDRAHALRSSLTTWVRVLWDLHAVRWWECDGCDAKWLSGEQRHDQAGCAGQWRERVDELLVGDTVTDLARWLLRHPSWMRAHPAVDELYHEVTSAVNSCWRVIDTPLDTRVFLGVCGFGDAGACRQELFVGRYSRDPKVRCPACGDEWVVEERRSWMLGNVEDEVLSTSMLSALLTRIGLPCTVRQIQTLAKTGVIVAVREDSSRRRYYRAGQVLSAVVADRKNLKEPA